MSPDALRDAAKNAARCLSGARLILDKTYPDGDQPAGLLPVLVIAIALLATDHNFGETKHGK